ncbi:MAG TPA: hypothetical protein VMZ53_13800 [Kofleriaceae bacterium]|nr:hypothetical protein [Kofleriaceae bacterium]
MRWIAATLLLSTPTAALAEDGITETADAQPSKHLVYVEALGKGGLYGIGYEHGITSRLALGAAGSFAVVSDQQVLTFAPYVHGTIVAGRRHAFFTEVGAVLAHSHLPSPVEGWDGMSDSGGGGFASLGWEYRRNHVVLRASGSVVAGEGGIGPMFGFAVGVRP